MAMFAIRNDFEHIRSQKVNYMLLVPCLVNFLLSCYKIKIAKMLFRFTACMYICLFVNANTYTYMFVNAPNLCQDTVTFNIKYCSVLSFLPYSYVKLCTRSIDKEEKPGHLVNFGQLL